MKLNLLKYVIIFVVTMCYGQLLYSQSTYFQQDVDYKISVTLIDSIHVIQGNISIDYTNNAPSALNEIYIHLWGNAFKTRTTAFAKQQIRTGSTKFHFSDEEEYGYYDQLDFKVDGKAVNWSLDEEDVDIALLNLNVPIEPGQTIQISTPLKLKIPASFSRLGHVGTSYQMTQWFPKPAVYDQNGWHQMPYLNMGEFYSEFGDFEVDITLPENYFVGASGELQTKSEKDRIEERIKYTNTYLQDSSNEHTVFPTSSESMKTLKFIAKNVHDFAWFADKRFLIQRETVILDSGKEVECTAFFTDREKELWKKGAFYIARSVKFYSDRVGEYPYPQATAVQSALSAGGGMEYPMITVIGLSGSPEALDQVITHEVGHNWFYGILASNERDFPWMDEGMNSYHDHKYMEVFYDNYDATGGMMPKKIKKQLDYEPLSYGYHMWARLGKDQAPNTTSNDLTSVNYFIGAYEKPAMVFKVLENYLGEDRIIQAMHDYYEKWKFKHPQPEDTKASFEASTGEDLDWLFDGFLFSNDVYDYKIKSINRGAQTAVVNNSGTVAAPFQITYWSGEEGIKGSWHKGFLGTQEIKLENIATDYIQIDEDKISLDQNPSNDKRKIYGGLKKGPIALRFLSGINNSKLRKTFVLPTIGGNVSDGGQIGLAFHNYGIPVQSFQYYIQPVLGFRSGELLGSFEFRKDLPQKKKGSLRNISIALGGKSFHEFKHPEIDYNLRFSRIVPSVELEWQKKLVSPGKHFLRYRPIVLVNDRALFGRETGFEGLEQNVNVIHDIAYEYAKTSPLNPMNARLNAEYRSYTSFSDGEQYLKLYGSVDTKFAYKAKRFVNIRVFGGFFPLHSERDRQTSSALGNFSMFHRGSNDYRYDHNFIDRTGQSGFFSRQVTWSDGGFKNGVSNSQPIGLSNNYMAAANFSVDLPFKWTTFIPIKPYFDAGIYSFKPTSEEAFRSEVIYSGGIMLDFQRVVNVYLPLFSSENLANVTGEGSGNLWSRISFNIDLHELNPHRLKRWYTR